MVIPMAFWIEHTQVFEHVDAKMLRRKDGNLIFFVNTINSVLDMETDRPNLRMSISTRRHKLQIHPYIQSET